MPAAFYCGLLLPELAGCRTARQVRAHLSRRRPGLLRRLFGGGPWDVDHFVPRRWGGSDAPWNYVLMPRADNRRFGDRIEREKLRLLCRPCLAAVSAGARGAVEEPPAVAPCPACARLMVADPPVA